jgi:hypothetical protein
MSSRHHARPEKDKLERVYSEKPRAKKGPSAQKLKIKGRG